jgi:hypothetical protein
MKALDDSPPNEISRISSSWDLPIQLLGKNIAMKSILSLIHALLTCVICEAGDVQDLIQETRKLEAVEGEFVGVGGTPGRFYEIAKALHAVMKGPDIDKLLADADPRVVCMGIVLLAQDHKNNEQKLRKLFGDKREFQVCPAGCVIEGETVGQFAQTLLLDDEERSYFDLTPEPDDKKKETPSPQSKEAQQGAPSNGG